MVCLAKLITGNQRKAFWLFLLKGGQNVHMVLILQPLDTFDPLPGHLQYHQMNRQGQQRQNLCLNLLEELRLL